MSEVMPHRHVTHEEIADRIAMVEKRLGDGSAEFADIKADLDAIRQDADHRAETLSALAKDVAATRELVELLTIAKAAGRWAIGTARAIKWAGGIAGAVAAFFILAREFGLLFNPKG